MSVEISTLKHITQADIDAILSQPITPEVIVQTELNHDVLPAPRLREVGEDYSDEIKTASKKAIAVVAIAAEVLVLNGKPASDTHQTPPSIVAEAKTATQVATENHEAASASGGDKPMTDKELKQLYETNPYTRAMANGDGSAAVISVKDIPEGLTVGQATLIAVKNNPGLDPNKFAKSLPITNPQLIAAPDKGEDIMLQPIKHEEGGVVVMAGAMASSIGQFREDAKNLVEAQQSEAQAPKEITVESLMQEVLNHPNITIGNDPGTGDRVRKSMQDALDDGKTFGHDLSQEANQNIAVNPRLLQIVLFIANKGHKISIDSMTTGNHTANSNHWDGNAMDILPQGVPNNESHEYYAQPEIIAKFQPIYKDMYDARDELKLTELIYGFPNEGTTGIRNGGPFTFFGDTRLNHYGHIHFSTNNREIITEPDASNTLSQKKLDIINGLPIEQYKKDNLIEILPLAMQTSLNPTVTVGQWWVESNAGKDCPGNNCFGMKPDGYWNGAVQTFTTFEYINGKKVVLNAEFKAYNPDRKIGLKEGLIDHDALIRRAPHYKDAVAAKDDWRAYLHALVNPGEPAYATAPNYKEVIADLIVSNHIEELTAPE